MLFLTAAPSYVSGGFRVSTATMSHAAHAHHPPRVNSTGRPPKRRQCKQLVPGLPQRNMHLRVRLARRTAAWLPGSLAHYIVYKRGGRQHRPAGPSLGFFHNTYVASSSQTNIAKPQSSASDRSTRDHGDEIARRASRRSGGAGAAGAGGGRRREVQQRRPQVQEYSCYSDFSDLRSLLLNLRPTAAAGATTPASAASCSIDHHFK